VAPVSPFVPVAIENVIDSLVNAITQKKLAPSAKPPVAVLLKDVTGFWAPIAIGANRMSGRLVCPTVVEAPLIVDESVSEDVKAVEQNKYIQKYLDSRLYQAMAVAPFSATGDSVQYINEFVAQCGPVVTIDSDSPDSQRAYNIATANYQAGLTAASTIRKVLNTGDAVAVFGTTDPSWESGLERAQGAEDGAAAAGLTVAPRIPVVWNDDTDLASIVAAISDPTLNIKGLLCMYSDSDRCAAAVEAVGKKGGIQIVGFDMEAATKTYFDQGYFYGIAVQRQYYMGELGVLVPYSIETIGPAKTAALIQPILVDGFLLDTGLDIITSDNYANYIDYLSSLGINS
jgi:ribose transport system substrate-binding protein